MFITAIIDIFQNSTGLAVAICLIVYNKDIIVCTIIICHIVLLSETYICNKLLRMKYLLLFTCIIFYSCALKPYTGLLSDEATKARDAGRNFIVTTEGKKIFGSDVLKARKKGKIVIMVDDAEYPKSDVAIMQTDEGFFLKRDNIFNYRICNGKIQAFCETITNNDRNTTSCYLATNQVDFYHYTSKNLYEMVKGNPEAVKVFNSKYKSINGNRPIDIFYGKLLAVLKTYNGNK